MKAFNIFALFLGLILGVVPAVAGTIVIGLPPVGGSGFEFPFGAPYPEGIFQEVYNNGQFNGPVTIGSVDFYNTTFGHPPTVLDVGQVTIWLSTTSADWDTLSGDTTSNLGPNNTEVFNGIIDEPWDFPDTLTFVLDQPFTYVPADGNLLLTVEVSNGPTSTNEAIYFDVNGQFTRNDYMSMIAPGTEGYGQGLVTGFGTEPAVPEPSSLILLGSGLIGVFGAVRGTLKR